VPCESRRACLIAAAEQEKEFLRKGSVLRTRIEVNTIAGADEAIVIEVAHHNEFHGWRSHFVYFYYDPCATVEECWDESNHERYEVHTLCAKPLYPWFDAARAIFSQREFAWEAAQKAGHIPVDGHERYSHNVGKTEIWELAFTESPDRFQYAL
jgi:hypothetical protein